MNIILPQSIAILLLTIAVVIPTTLWGWQFAIRIKERPFKKTWLEVVAGVSGSELAIFLLSEGTFWVLGILALVWWIPIVYPALIWGITGGCQIYHQEKKISLDKETSAKIKTLDDVRWLE